MPRIAVAAKMSEPGPLDRAGQMMPAMEDRLLLERIARRDGQAFRLLVDRHLASVVRLSRRMLGEEAEADDIAQEAMLRLWRNAGTLVAGPQGIRPWLLKVASNLCLDRLRSARRVDVTDDLPEQAEDPVQIKDLEDRELSERVEAAVRGLPERQRLALTLFHYEGLSHVETGAMMGISNEAVESLLSRARRTLKVTLAGEWQAFSGGEET